MCVLSRYREERGREERDVKKGILWVTSTCTMAKAGGGWQYTSLRPPPIGVVDLVELWKLLGFVFRSVCVCSGGVERGKTNSSV